jgi:type I restriction enzyme, R subunit
MGSPPITDHYREPDVHDLFLVANSQYSPEAKDILNDLLEKYAEHGTTQFMFPDILKVPPLSEHGTVTDIVSTFGGVEKLREAVAELQTLLYAAA